MSKFPYQFFNSFVVRTPILSYKEFQSAFFDKNCISKYFENQIQNKLFRESLYLASADLSKELEKYLDNNISVYKNRNLYFSLLKYYNRASTRCTPFGLFSGVSVGNFEQETNFLNKESDIFKIRDTKLDTHFLVSFSNSLTINPDIRDKILFYPNNSIYNVGDKIRYIENEAKEGKRDYFISSAPLSDELKKILHLSKEGKKFEDLANYLANKEISLCEAIDYINELIDNQVLVSELEPIVAGKDFLDSIISILEKIKAFTPVNILTSIKNKLDEIDSVFGNPSQRYIDIKNEIEKLEVQYDSNYLFQTDLYFNNKISLSYLLKKEIKKGISFLNKITLPSTETAIEKFKIAFYEKFELEEVPLSIALDPEIGVGYLRNNIKGIHPYIEDLLLPSITLEKELQIKLNPVQNILNQKLQELIWNKSLTITLSDNDFENFKENWNDLSVTKSLMGEIITVNGQEKLFINNVSCNAGKLLGRFCSERSIVKSLVKDISRTEEELISDKILAEIIHLPEYRIGNVIRRPILRKHEIPYLANSVLTKENQIFVDDLHLSIKNNQLFLRSKKFNKEVIPCLTNAHNYSYNSLPVYHFLCDYVYQNKRHTLQLDWGGLALIYDFLPRIEYENIILSKARWKINQKQIMFFYDILKVQNYDILLENVEAWRSQKQIPQWVQWVKGDNTLLINFKNIDLIEMFLSSVKNEKEIYIEEFLCNEKSDFINQFIIPLYKCL